jgi:hypothetical protein
MRFMNFKIGKSKEKPEKDAGTDDTIATQEAEIKEQTKNNTKDPKAAAKQSKEPSDTSNDSEEGEETPPQPHGPLSELSVDPNDKSADEDIDIDAQTEEASEEVEVVKVSAEATAPAEAEKATAEAQESDSLSNLFSDDEEEENPLANLINSLPDVTTQELLDDLKEIKEIIQEWQRK